MRGGALADSEGRSDLSSRFLGTPIERDAGGVGDANIALESGDYGCCVDDCLGSHGVLKRPTCRRQCSGIAAEHGFSEMQK